MPSAPRAEATGEAPKVRSSHPACAASASYATSALPQILHTLLLTISSADSHHAFALRELRGATDAGENQSRDKLTRFGPFSSHCRAGNVKILRGLWNEDLFRVLEGFPDLAHDDEVDACSGALEMLNPEMKSWGIFEFDRQQAEQLRAAREARGANQSTQPE